MEKLVNSENLRSFAYVNDQVCKRPIRGIVLFFEGLGGMPMYQKDTADGIRYGEKGLLYVYPYNNPWAWMNRQAATYTDEIMDAVFEAFQLPEGTPIVASGHSMGGQSALVYTRYAKRTPAVCVPICPVCDMVYHFTERPDLPRTLYSALYHEEGTMEDALRAISPLHLAEQLPAGTAYHLILCDADDQVSMEQHGLRFLAAMEKLGRTITADVDKGMAHCKLSEEMRQRFHKYCEAIGE